MTRNYSLLLLILLLGLAAAGCQKDEPVEPSGADEPEITETSAPSPEAVTYEPAYPTDVSEEALSAEDEAQQESVDAHGEGEGEHTHDDDGEPDDHDH